MNKFDQGDAGVGTVVVAVVSKSWMTSDKFPPLVGFGQKLFTGKNKTGFALFDAETKGFADGRPKCSTVTTGTPAVNHLEHTHPSCLGGLNLADEPAACLIDRGVPGFEIDGGERH